MIALPAGSFALVTGASAGIGEAIARGLARRKVPLLLVARSEEKLVALADELRSLSGVAAEAIVLDLASEGAAERLVAATDGAGKPVGLLVNNAAFGFYGPQEEQDLERTLRMLKLNVEALVDLTHRLLAPMRVRRGGYVLNVASTAAFLPVPYMAVYAATKAFVLSYSQALHEELLGRGVVVTALCPGTTRTDFHRVAGLASGTSNPFPSLSAETVAEVGLRGLELGKAIVVPNLLDSAWIFTGRLVPRTLPPRIGAAVFSRLKRTSPV
ncbi:MAG TPA: SDR family oxidoreductase [Thermoanaerobaculia bacterium]|nr:SDR family oxidoreductase [Thermoanaerobaculia bacterium]